MLKNIIYKKRYKAIATLSIGTHIIGALFVLYSLMFDTDNWINYMENIRIFIGLKEHKHIPATVLNVWMID